MKVKLSIVFVCAWGVGLIGQSLPPTRKLTPEQRGDVYMARKMYREAIDVYSLIPADSAVRWNKIGIAYHELQDLTAAKTSYERAVKLNPHYGEAVNNLGTLFYAAKDYHRAIKHYRKALRFIPDSASIYSNLGTAYFARQDYKRANFNYQKALTLDPGVFDHHDSFGVMLEEHTVAERARFHYYLAKMYAEQNRPDRALEYMRKAIEEGFLERKRFLEEPEFARLRDTPGFQEIVRSQPRIL